MSIIKIQTEKPAIPIEIGKLKFEFDVTDESVIAFRKNAAKVQEELEAIEFDEEDENGQEIIKDVLRRGFDLMLGKDSFDKIYKVTPSVMIVMKYFVQLSEGIGEQLQGMGFNESQQEKAQKYIQSKKQNKKIK